MGTISGTLRCVKYLLSARFIIEECFDSAHPDACVIWIDAHADINTAESTDSGTWIHYARRYCMS